MLINRSDIAIYKQISKTVFDDVLNQFISEAQFVDLRPLMGDDFYNDLLRNETNANYQNLLNGGIYTYKGVTYTNVGLKAVISHYAYARYVLQGSQVDTPFGYLEKTNQNSQPVSYDNKKTVYKMNQQTAYAYWENVVNFLNRNYTDYPLWQNNCPTSKSFRISRIG